MTKYSQQKGGAGRFAVRRTRLKGKMDEHKIKQSDLLYDYIKFHIALYLATPAGLALVGGALDLEDKFWYKVGLAVALLCNLIAGGFACCFISKHLFEKWYNFSKWKELGEQGASFWRKALHHWLYWVGLFSGLAGIILAWSSKDSA